MKTFLLIIGVLIWIAVGSTVIINQYDSATHKQAAQAASTQNTVSALQNDLNSANNAATVANTKLSTSQGNLKQVCSLLAQAQATLTKDKVNLPVPAVCTTTSSQS